jgi:succinate dehydrogenase/fumarate reductase flavoprotein subunit
MGEGRVEKHLSTDLLVIGGGMAGLFAAIKAREQGLDVILTDKGYVGRSGGTHYAEGDIQFFRPKERGHNLDQWLKIIGNNCSYLNNPEWNAIVLTECEDRYNDLVSWGVEFYEEEGQVQVDGPHVFTDTPPVYEFISMRNREYAPSLRRKAVESGVRVLDRIMTCELLKQDGRVVGAAGFHTTSGHLYVLNAKATVIATGGGSHYKTWSHSTDYWTGDGEGMAYRVGAEIAGKEFHWGFTSGITPKHPKQRKQGDAGKTFEITRQYPYVTIQSGWLWPTLTAEGTRVAHGPLDAHKGKAPFYYDLDAMSPGLEEWLRKYFKRVGSAEPDKIGLDFFDGGKIRYTSARTAIGSVMGGSGIWPVDKYCSSGLPGLYAAGGSCATMVSGASYGGMGMGLTSGMVTGARAAKAASEYISRSEVLTIDEANLAEIKELVRAPMDRKGGFSPAWLTQVLQGLMVPYYVLLVKHEERLQAALTFVEFMNNHLVPKLRATDPHEWRMAHETKNMVLNAEMQLRASLFRTESRGGGHYREDYPAQNDAEWLAWVKLKDVDGEMKLSKEPVPEKFWPDPSTSAEGRYFPLPTVHKSGL